MWKPWAHLLAVPCWRGLTRPKQLSMAVGFGAVFLPFLVATGSYPSNHCRLSAHAWGLNILTLIIVTSAQVVETSVCVTNNNPSLDSHHTNTINRFNCHQQQSFSGLLSPGRSNHTNTINSFNCHQQQSFCGLLSPERSNHTNTINSFNCHQQQSFCGLLSPERSNHTNTINSFNCHQQQSFSGLLSPERSNHTNTINSFNCHQQQSFSEILSPGRSNQTNNFWPRKVGFTDRIIIC